MNLFGRKEWKTLSYLKIDLMKPFFFFLSFCFVAQNQISVFLLWVEPINISECWINENLFISF